MVRAEPRGAFDQSKAAIGRITFSLASICKQFSCFYTTNWTAIKLSRSNSIGPGSNNHTAVRSAANATISASSSASDFTTRYSTATCTLADYSTAVTSVADCSTAVCSATAYTSAVFSTAGSLTAAYPTRFSFSASSHSSPPFDSMIKKLEAIFESQGISQED
jgi:hypothetical protein